MTGNPEEPFGARESASPGPAGLEPGADITSRYGGGGAGPGPVAADLEPVVDLDAPRPAGSGASTGDRTAAEDDFADTGADGGATRPDEPTPPLERILESILLVVDEPVGESQLAQVTEQPRVKVTAALEALAADYAAAGRGFELRNVAGGWRLYTAPDCAAYVERFVLEGQQARLTQAALETLAVVAYRQPVSRQAIAAIRGVNVDGVIRTLLTRGLVAEVGEDPSSGAHLYGTTPYFLERLGVASLDDLPQLAPLLPTSLDDIDAS